MQPLCARLSRRTSPTAEHVPVGMRDEADIRKHAEILARSEPAAERARAAGIGHELIALDADWVFAFQHFGRQVRNVVGIDLHRIHAVVALRPPMPPPTLSMQMKGRLRPGS